MDGEWTLRINLPGFSARRLTPGDAPVLQRLFDRCPDYAELVEGKDVSPTAAQELFQALPPGGSFFDKRIIGMFGREGEIIGVLEAARNYPEENIWWIGLLLLAPDVRNQGVGRKTVKEVVGQAESQGVRSVMLGVVEDNRLAFRFWSNNGFDLVRKTEPRLFGKKIQSVFVMQRRIQ
jgi:GNAT superfamily N-acetyltransferase